MATTAVNKFLIPIRSTTEVYIEEFIKMVTDESESDRSATYKILKELSYSGSSDPLKPETMKTDEDKILDQKAAFKKAMSDAISEKNKELLEKAEEAESIASEDDLSVKGILAGVVAEVAAALVGKSADLLNNGDLKKIMPEYEKAAAKLTMIMSSPSAVYDYVLYQMIKQYQSGINRQIGYYRDMYDFYEAMNEIISAIYGILTYLNRQDWSIIIQSKNRLKAFLDEADRTIAGGPLSRDPETGQFFFTQSIDTFNTTGGVSSASGDSQMSIIRLISDARSLMKGLERLLKAENAFLPTTTNQTTVQGMMDEFMADFAVISRTWNALEESTERFVKEAKKLPNIIIAIIRQHTQLLNYRRSILATMDLLNSKGENAWLHGASMFANNADTILNRVNAFYGSHVEALTEMEKKNAKLEQIKLFVQAVAISKMIQTLYPEAVELKDIQSLNAYSEIMKIYDYLKTRQGYLSKKNASAIASWFTGHLDILYDPSSPSYLKGMLEAIRNAQDGCGRQIQILYVELSIFTSAVNTLDARVSSYSDEIKNLFPEGSEYDKKVQGFFENLNGATSLMDSVISFSMDGLPVLTDVLSLASDKFMKKPDTSDALLINMKGKTSPFSGDSSEFIKSQNYNFENIASADSSFVSQEIDKFKGLYAYPQIEHENQLDQQAAWCRSQQETV